MNCRENDHYHTHILIITKQLTYDNENLTKMMNLCIIELCSLKII
jgi:hypothetical protein